MIDSFLITANGRLVCDMWDYEKKIRLFKQDVTSKLKSYLDMECQIEDGVVGKSIAKLLQTQEKYLSPLLTHNDFWLEEFIMEKENPNYKEISKVVLKREAYIGSDIYKEYDKIYERYDFYGISDKNNDTYSINSLAGISNAKIEIDNNYVLKDKDDNIILETKKDFSLFEILFGIFHNISLHGGPKNRDRFFESLERQSKEIGPEETLSSEEVFEKIKQKLK